MTHDPPAKAAAGQPFGTKPASRSHRPFDWLVAGGGFLLTLLTFYPGFITVDSLGQYEQAIHFDFGDWHPPVMALLWSMMNAVWPGPQSMLLLQAGLYWCSVYFILSSISTERTAVRWGLMALLFSPAILNFAGVIWKDQQLAAVWAFASGYAFWKRSHVGELGAAEKICLLVPVCYGALVRQNSSLVAAPVVLYLLIGRPWTSRPWSTAAAYLGIAILALGLGQTLNVVLRARADGAINGLFSFDIAGTSVRANENLYPFALKPEESAKLKECYGDGINQNALIWGDCGFIWSDIEALDNKNAAMRHAWLSAIERHPGQYLTHRLAFYGQFLALTTRHASYFLWQAGSEDNHFGFTTRKGLFYYVMQFYVKKLSVMPIFRPAIWLGLPLLFLALSCRRTLARSTELDFIQAMCVLSSLYMLTYLPFGVAEDFRYCYISIVATTFALCVMLANPRSPLRSACGSLRTGRKADFMR